VGTAKRERQKANRQLRLEEIQKQQQQAKRKRNFLRYGVGLVVAVLVVWLISWLSTRNDKSSTAASTTTSAAVTTVPGTTVPGTTVAPKPFVYGTGECAPASKPATAPKTFAAAPKLCIDLTKSYSATMDTSEGTVEIALDTKRTPGTTNNFVTLSRYGFYDNTPLFRTDTSIDIIQGGGQTNADQIGYTIPDEGGQFTYTAGDFVMARTQAADSGGAQFFFSTGPNTANLDGQGTYVTFGKVTKGLDVLQKIIGLDAGGKPSHTVTIKTVTITES
jgi:cyclophilin family peptidyl-prolyl cis-trans isomerase